jgi:hypothetical protein
VQPREIHIAGSHIVMRWHDQMRQWLLDGQCRRRRIARCRQPTDLPDDPIQEAIKRGLYIAS